MRFFRKLSTGLLRKKKKNVGLDDSLKEYDIVCAPRDDSSAFVVRIPKDTESDDVILVKKSTAKTAQLEDLADERIPKNELASACLSVRYVSGVDKSLPVASPKRNLLPKKSSGEVAADVAKSPQDASKETIDDPIVIIRKNLPPDVVLSTPFGMRRLTYADYTASGRPLRFVEEYIQRVVGPLFANTHTETSATGLQTTHFREEARSIILKVSQQSAPFMCGDQF